MLSSNHAIFKLAAAASLVITAMGAVQAQGVPTPPPPMGASTAPIPAPVAAPVAPKIDKTKAPQAPGAKRQADDAESASGMSLTEFATLERKRALSSLRKEIKEAQEAEKKSSAPAAPPSLPGINQLPPGFGFRPGMALPPGVTPAMLARMGPGAAGMFPPPGPRHKVVSIVSFRDDVRADVVDGELITTVRVGDRLGTGKVVSIDVARGVSVESVGPKGTVTLAKLPPATDMEPRPDAMNQMSHMNGIPPLPGAIASPMLPPDATNVPLTFIPPRNPARQ